MISERGAATWVAAVLCLVVAGCRTESRRIDGLERIRATGELRVIIRPGYLYAPPSIEGQVDEIALIRQLAARLDVAVRWVECPRHDLIVPWLIEGRGDIAVSRLPPAALLGTAASPTVALEWVEDLLVASANPVELSFGGLAGKQVHLYRSSLTGPLSLALQEEGLEFVPIPEEISHEELVDRVRRRRYQMTVVDSGLLERGPARRGLQVIGPLAARRPLVWAIRERNLRLRRAVDDFLFAEQVLSRSWQSAECRDLPQVRRERMLRLVTRNSPTTYTVERGGLEGFEYDLALAFARQLDLRLELSIPPPGVNPLDWLGQGYGDIAALHEPVAPEDEGAFLVSVWYRKVDLVSVISQRSQPPATVAELSGVEVAASRPVASLCRMLPLDPEIVAYTPDGGDALSALLQVARGRAEIAVVDSDTARLELDNRPDLQMGPVVIPKVPLVWIANVSSPRLHRAMNAFLREARMSGLARLLARSELGTWKPYVSPDVPDIPAGALTPYDELLQWVGRNHGIDWRLLASLMYEESRFNPEAVGPGGSAGLFQFMPFVSRDLGVEDPHHPGDAAEAGGWYLRWLMDKFADLELPDRVAMAIASYNVGPRHVFDARQLARAMGLDADRWRDNVETAMLILDDPEVARQYPAGVCRCRRAVGYTRRILRRYRAYTEQFSPE